MSILILHLNEKSYKIIKILSMYHEKRIILYFNPDYKRAVTKNKKANCLI